MMFNILVDLLEDLEYWNLRKKWYESELIKDNERMDQYQQICGRVMQIEDLIEDVQYFLSNKEFYYSKSLTNEQKKE